jgi:hypothetical protein
MIIITVNGGREWFSLQNMSREEVAKWLEVYRTSAGYGEMHFKNYHHTDCPSVQGVWNPFTNQSAQTNVMQFPNVSLFWMGLSRVIDFKIWNCDFDCKYVILCGDSCTMIRRPSRIQRILHQLRLISLRNCMDMTSSPDELYNYIKLCIVFISK